MTTQKERETVAADLRDQVDRAVAGLKVSQLLGLASWTDGVSLASLREAADQATAWLGRHGLAKLTTMSDARPVLAEINFAIVLDWFEASRDDLLRDRLADRLVRSPGRRP